MINILYTIFCCFVFLETLVIAEVKDEKVVSETILDFKIGVSAPMSGDLAYVGQEIVRGLELAKSDFNNEHLNFSIIVEDDQFLGKNAAIAGKKLLDIDKVDAIISLWDMSEIIAPMAEEKKIPHFAIRWNPHVAERYSYTMTIESTYISYMVSEIMLLKHLNIHSVSLILEEAEGWLLGAKRLETLLKENNIKLIHQVNYSRGELDHRNIVLKSLKEPSDIILLFSNPPNVEPIIKRIKELRPNQRFSGYFEILDHPEVSEGMPFVAQLQPADWFVKKYNDNYHSLIRARAPQSYDILALIANSFKNRPSKPSSEEIIQHISSTQNFPGASGPLNAKGTRTIEMDCVWKVVKNGKFELYP